MPRVSIILIKDRSWSGMPRFFGIGWLLVLVWLSQPGTYFGTRE